jgi:endonuclease-3
MDLMAEARKITTRLLRQYPQPKIALRFSNPLQLLIATILSAQCTDARVNEVTHTLFRKYKKAGDFAGADPRAFEEEIRPTGFYRNKARTVVACCKALCEEFAGKVPESVEELTRLPGVGRKTANMVLGNAFGRQAIAVDTHVARVSNRLGLATGKNADKIEAQLTASIPEKHWTEFTNAMILHGRQVCTARNPRCCDCVLYGECAWKDKPKC